MNVVLVQHNEQSTKKYCFGVPDRLMPYVEYGSDVICDTRRGNMPGKIVSQIMTDEEAGHAIAEHGVTIPLKNIVAVVKNINIANIQIPISMILSEPRESKLAKRRRELKTFGCVKTKVRVDDDGILRDGYTAYLVCKNKGMATIPVAIGV